MAQSAPTSITKFYDANERPPQRGWHYFYGRKDVKSYFRRSSAEEVFAELKRFRVNNGLFVSDIDLWRELWSYWCEQEPGRCGHTQSATVDYPAMVVPREITPDLFGPILWRMMNLLAARFEAVGRGFFVVFMTETAAVMTCPDCIEEWQKILRADPPEQVHDRKAACQWVNRAHNSVNARRGVAQYSYERGVTEYGWPML